MRKLSTTKGERERELVSPSRLPFSRRLHQRAPAREGRDEPELHVAQFEGVFRQELEMGEAVDDDSLDAELLDELLHGAVDFFEIGQERQGVGEDHAQASFRLVALEVPPQPQGVRIELRGELLEADVQPRLAAFLDALDQELQSQGGLARAGCALDEIRRAFDETSGSHPVQSFDSRGNPG